MLASGSAHPVFTGASGPAATSIPGAMSSVAMMYLQPRSEAFVTYVLLDKPKLCDGSPHRSRRPTSTRPRSPAGPSVRLALQESRT